MLFWLLSNWAATPLTCAAAADVPLSAGVLTTPAGESTRTVLIGPVGDLEVVGRVEGNVLALKEAGGGGRSVQKAAHSAAR